MSNETTKFPVMAVTAVEVFPFKEGPSLGHIRGLARVILNDQLTLNGLRILDGENGLFVGYPNDPFYKGEDYRCICHPITLTLKQHIETCVIEKFKAAIANP